MKLYTEEQVIEAISKAFRYNSNVAILKSLTPTELPSDEEAAKAARRYCEDTPDNDPIRILAFIEGAKWVIEQIKQQDK